MSKSKEDEFPGWRVSILAGMTQATLVTATGYPLDLFKSRMQSLSYKNTWECARDIFVNGCKDGGLSGGIKGLYRGASMPWVSHMIKRPTQLPISEFLKSRYTSSLKNNEKGKMYYNYLIGAACGVTGAIFGTPLQVIKIGMQTAHLSYIPFGPIDYAKKEISLNGMKGLYRGFVPTLIKDILFGAWFIGSYYSIRDIVGTDTWYKNFFNGSAAHCVTWSLLIPVDYVKTNIQRDQSGNKTVLSVIKEGYLRGGLRIFWKGVIPACARTVPVSGVAMTGYEYVRRKLI
jgi:solute carrier family 25 (mitochondrial carnitine/acylcarnitine transporter), member 20/29